MHFKTRLASLLVACALSPASCLPHSDHPPDARSIHSARAAAPFKLPGWEIVVIIAGLILGLILFGVIGGACETLVCLYFKRPVRDDPVPSQEGLDFGCQGEPSGMPEIRVVVEKETGDQASAFHAESSLGRSGSTISGGSSHSNCSSSFGGTNRYSWQDEKGVTTEMYIDGTLPDAGPRTTAESTVSHIQYQGYQVQSAMRGYEGVHYQGPGAGLASNPPFVLHNEEDDSDYEDDVACPSPQSENPTDFAVAVSTDEVVSPLTPEAQTANWPHQAVSTDQAARYFADVDLENDQSSTARGNPDRYA